MHFSWKAVRKNSTLSLFLARKEKTLPSKVLASLERCVGLSLTWWGNLTFIPFLVGLLPSFFKQTRPLPPAYTHIPSSTKKTKSSAALFFRLLVEWMFGSLCFCCCLLYYFPSQSDQPRLCSANDTIAVPWGWRKYKNVYMGTYYFCSRQKEDSPELRPTRMLLASNWLELKW